MTDHELLKRFVRTNSQDDFALLVQRHAGLVFKTCLRVLNDPHSAEDAAQATFLILMKKAESLQDCGVLAGWLHRTAQYAARDIKKSQRRRHEYEMEAQQRKHSCGSADSQIEGLRKELDDSLSALPENQRHVVILRYLQGYSHAQVAAELNCPLETVHTRLTRGLSALREQLDHKGVCLSLPLLTGFLESDAHAHPPVELVTSIQHACRESGAAVPHTLNVKSHIMSEALSRKIGATGLASALIIGVATLCYSRSEPVRNVAVPNRIQPEIKIDKRLPVVQTSQPPPAQLIAAAPPIEVRGAQLSSSVSSSLLWLSRVQQQDGHFDGAKMGAQKNQDVAVTALAMLAFLSHGNTEKTGPYADNVKRGIDWLRQQRPADPTQIALRALVLVEHYGMSQQHREAAQGAIEEVAKQQQPSGSWTNANVKTAYEHGLEPTTWSVFALRSSQAAGLNIDQAVMNRAIRSLESQQHDALKNKNGSDPLVAASIANQRFLLGEKATDVSVKSLTQSLMDHKPSFTGGGLGAEINTWYHGTIAALMNEEKWSEWNLHLQTALVHNQVTQGEFAGSWNVRLSTEQNFKWGRIGATALATLCLEMSLGAKARNSNAAQPKVAPPKVDSQF